MLPPTSVRGIKPRVISIATMGRRAIVVMRRGNGMVEMVVRVAWRRKATVIGGRRRMISHALSVLVKISPSVAPWSKWAIPKRGRKRHGCGTVARVGRDGMITERSVRRLVMV